MQTASKPFIVDSDGRSQFGRFQQPFLAANVADGYINDYAPWMRAPTAWNSWARALRLKEWHFLAVNHDDFFVAFAVAQLGYLSNLFIYCFDKRSKTMREWGERFLFGRHLQFGESSIAGQTVWQSRSHLVKIANEESGWSVTLRAGKDLDAAFFMQRDEAMALVYPLGQSRAGYTHKEAGNRVQGQLRVDGRDYQLTPNNCFGASDWSRSFSNRITQWYFACFGCLTAEGHRLGLNLSRLIFDDAHGTSQENTVWVDGRSFQVGSAQFILPDAEYLEQRSWRIEVYDYQNDNTLAVDLNFEPLGSRRENVAMGILTSKFTQVFGHYSGTITVNQRVHRIVKVFGVAEKHYSKW